MSISNCKSGSELLAAHGALDSMSEKELLGALAWLLVRGLGGETSPMAKADVCTELNSRVTLTTDLAGLARKQKLIALIAASPDAWWAANDDGTGANMTVKELRDLLCCVRCKDEAAIMGVILNVLCEYSQTL